MSTFPVITSTLSEKALNTLAISKYGFTKNCTCKLYKTGMNHTYFITDKTTKYVLRVYCHNWRTKTEITEEIKLLIALKENNINVSYPIADLNNSFIQDINAPEGLRHVVLFSFAEGKKIRFKDNETCFKIGTIMANIHNTTRDKTVKRTNYNIETLVKRPYECASHFFSETLEEMKYLKQQGDVISNTLKKANLDSKQQGIIHMDIWYDNMNITDQKDITIFDFDFCGNGYFVLDIGYYCKQLFHIETDNDTYEQKVDSFLKGYQSIKPLSKEELKLIPVAGAAVWIFYLGVQARRFDWSNIFLTENYLKLFYVARLKSWNNYYENKTLTIN